MGAPSVERMAAASGLALGARGLERAGHRTGLGRHARRREPVLKRARAGGPDALRHRLPPGATPKLTAEQRAQLPTLLAHGPEAYGFRGDVWTTKRVAAMIEQEFHVTYHPAHMSRLLRALGWSVQKPRTRASQRDETAIEVWTTERWPVLQAKP
jgi:transposase